MILCLYLSFQIKEEFKRIITIHLERTFLSKLDRHTTKLVEIFRKKGGIAGTKIRPMLDSLSEVNVLINLIALSNVDIIHTENVLLMFYFDQCLFIWMH